MNNWAYNLFCEARYNLKSLKKIIVSAFGFTGGFFTFSEILNQAFNSQWGYEIIHHNTIALIIIILILALVSNWKSLSHDCFLANEDSKISLIVGDIFKSHSAVVIPTNSTFDTLMDGDFISLQSVQGQFQNKYFKNNLIELNSKIEQGLRNVEYKNICDGRRTNTKRYPIGTTCKISIGANHFYLLAIADINESGKPENTSFQNLTTALETLWQTLNRSGHNENLSIPLIGTGRAGIKAASRDKVIQEIVFSFIASAKEMKVTEKLNIFIHPKDYTRKNIHWSDACDYLDYMCRFRYAEPDTKPEGQAESIVIARFG